MPPPQVFASYEIKASGSATTNLSFSHAVCYFTNEDSKKQYYASIEDGLKDANALEKSLKEDSPLKGKITVYAIPGLGNKIEIKESCTIDSGVTLTLPYDGETYTNTVTMNGQASKDSKGNYPANSFADTDESKRKVQVVLTTNHTLTVNGTLNIGGERGNAVSPNTQGQTTGSYAEILLQSSSYIECNGTIRCDGFIREDYGTRNTVISGEDERNGNGSYIHVASTGKVIEPLVIYDWRGGTDSGELHSVFPFNLFDLPQIAPKTIFDGGSNLTGSVNICAGWGKNKTNHFSEVVIVGKTSDNTGLFQSEESNSGGSITLKNTDFSKGTQITNLQDTSHKILNTHALDISIRGKYSFESLTITIGDEDTSYSSADYYFPLSNLFQIQLTENTESTSTPTDVTLSKDVKLLPGSSLTIGKNATLTTNRGLLVHSYTDSGVTDPRPKDYYSTEVGQAVLKNDGTLKLQNLFGGKVTTDADTKDAKVETSGFLGDSLTVKEISSGITTAEFTYQPTGDVYDHSTKTLTLVSLTKNGTYSHLEQQSGWSFKANDFAININCVTNPDYELYKTYGISEKINNREKINLVKVLSKLDDWDPEGNYTIGYLYLKFTITTDPSSALDGSTYLWTVTGNEDYPALSASETNTNPFYYGFTTGNYGTQHINVKGKVTTPDGKSFESTFVFDLAMVWD